MTRAQFLIDVARKNASCCKMIGAATLQPEAKSLLPPHPRGAAVDRERDLFATYLRIYPKPDFDAAFGDSMFRRPYIGATYLNPDLPPKFDSSRLIFAIF